MHAGGCASVGIDLTALDASFRSSNRPPYSMSSVLIISASTPTLASSSLNLPALSNSTMFLFSGTVGDRRFRSTVTLIFIKESSPSDNFFKDFVRLYLMTDRASVHQQWCQITSLCLPALRRHVPHPHH